MICGLPCEYSYRTRCAPTCMRGRICYQQPDMWALLSHYLLKRVRGHCMSNFTYNGTYHTHELVQPILLRKGFTRLRICSLMCTAGVTSGRSPAAAGTGNRGIAWRSCHSKRRDASCISTAFCTVWPATRPPRPGHLGPSQPRA